MQIERTALIMLAAALRESARRQAAVGERLLTELEEMGRRMLAVSVPGRDQQDAVLAEQLATASGWPEIDVLRIPLDMAPIEAVALVLMINPDRALQLLAEYPG